MRASTARLSRGGLIVRAELTSRGRAILPSSIKVDRIMGEGSFGQVFQGAWKTPSGEEKVVLKRVKAKVEGAAQMGQMELLLNAYAAKVARNHCADFLGYCEVADDEATARLTPGLWLMWKFEGSRTLSYYLRRRDTLRALASDLEVPEEAVVATVMKQLLEGLAAFHAAGLVHRDVKPLNIIFAEQRKRFKLIDLGACADLRTGTNYTPDESILDPSFCPPEQYVLPTDSPHLAKSFLRLAISPVLWAQHKPDRFDMWSAGITLLQLAVPAMRQDRVLKRFNSDFGAKYDYDLDAWRAGSYIGPRDFEMLDADNGAGWELAKALLRPRSIRVLDDNSVVFVNEGSSAQRISAGEALRHRFLKQAREPGCIMDDEYGSATSGGGSNQRGGSRAGSGSSGQRRSQAPAAAGRAGGGSNLRGGASSVPASSSAGSSGGGGGRQQRAGGTGAGDELAATAWAANARSGNAGAFGAAVGLWRNLTNKLFDLEANIMVMASATEQQSTVVRKLQQKAAQGQVPKEAVQKEVRKLGAMEQQLSQLQDDFNSTANAVGNVLGFLGFGPTKPAAPPSRSVAQPAGRQPSSSSKQQQGGRAGVSLTASSPTPSASGTGGGGGGFFSGLPFGQASAAPPRGGSAGTTSAPADGAASGTTGGGGGLQASLAAAPTGIWAAVQSKLADLESKFNNQIAATERQSFTVKKLRQGVKAGQVDTSTLQKAEAVLQRMERRVSELDQDLKRTRQEATGLLGLLASSVSQVTGGGGGTPGSSSNSGSGKAKPAAKPPTSSSSSSSSSFSSAPTAGSSSNTPISSPPTSLQKAQAPAAGGSSPGMGGVGNFFSRMFGGGQPSATPRPATALPSPAPPGSAKQQQQPSQAHQVPSSFPLPSDAGQREGGATSAGGEPAVASASSSLTDGASSIIASSLKFTGMAAKVALGMAAAMKADAEKVLREMEAEAQAKRARKMAEQAFLRMLATKVPPMGADTTIAEVEAFFKDDARYLAVEAAQRPLLVASYVDAVVQAQQRSAQQAQAKLRELLSLGLKLDSTWEEACAKFGDNPDFLAVEDLVVRRGVYDEVVAALQASEGMRLAVGLAEQAFMDLLQEVMPPIAPDTTWPRVKPLLWRDYRYLALPEARRKVLFDEMHTVVCEQARQEAEARAAKEAQEAKSVAELMAAALPAAGADTAPAVSPAGVPVAATAAPLEPTPAAAAAAALVPAVGGQQAPVNPSLLEDLRKQQARLRTEYETMERKLREMEAALITRERANQLLEQLPAPPGSAATRQAGGSSFATPPAARGGAATPEVARVGVATPTHAHHADGHGAPAAAAADAGPADVAPAVAGDGAAAAAAVGGGAPMPSGAHVVTGSGMRRSIIATPPMQRGGGDGSALGPSRHQQEFVQADQERVVADSLASAGVSYKRLTDGTLVFTFEPEDSEMGTRADGSPASSSASGSNMAVTPTVVEAQREPTRSRTPA